MEQNDYQTNWQIHSGAIDPNNYHGAMVGNGMIGMVSDARPMHQREVILNGVYDLYQRGRVSNILQTFKHLNVDLIIDGHFCNPEVFSRYEQVLDLHKACMTSQMEISRKVKITHDLRALRQLPNSGLVVVTIEALDDLQFELHNNIEGPDHLRDFQHYFSEIDRPHALIQLLSSVALSPSGRYELAAANAFLFQEPHGEEPRLIHEHWDQNRHLIKFKKALKKGETYQFGIIGTTLSSEEIGNAQNLAERVSVYAKLEGLDRLIQQHEKAWNDLWKSDIVIEGDPVIQRDVRMMLYNLYSSARAGSRLSLSPVGLSSLGYNGHVFWDTELWMYPPLLMLQPGMGKSMLDYRLDRLKAARQNAFLHGFQGAKFPWESAGSGAEETPVWALTGPFQIHISACIAWAFWKYYQMTQDLEWLRHEAWPLLKAVAEFWVSRVESTSKGYQIRNVIGANEFEENIDNNAFTNGMVKTVLRDTHTAAMLLGHSTDPVWMDIAENLPILEFPDGTTQENETYTGAEIKQSDANLLAFPVRWFRDEARIRKDLEFYEPRMSPDGPAMGVATLATIRARLNDDPDKAYELFVQSYRPNQLPPFGVLAEVAGGRGVSPYFMTGAGGTLQTLITGFGGIDLEDEGFTQTSVSLPSHWTALTIKGLGPTQKTVSIQSREAEIS
ncbi:MAG: glycoside hydrolase family 65 protein [Bacteroidota bacterium]